jgi:hypothetical protein
MLSFTFYMVVLNFIKMSVVMQNVIMPSVIMLSDIMLIVLAPLFYGQTNKSFIALTPGCRVHFADEDFAEVRTI